MKSYTWWIVLTVMLLALPAVSDATLIKQVQIAQATGAYANYDAGTGTVTWSAGASGWLMTDSYDIINFSDATVQGTFTGVTDTSSGGLASAVFSSGTWQLSFNGTGWSKPVFTIAGHILNRYDETETGVDTDKLDGRAVVIVDEAYLTLGFFSDWFGHEVTIDWKGGIGSMAGLIVDITLPMNTNITDYQSNYDSTNLVITLWADESVVPEPATVCLLGLGGLLALRRRKKA